GQRLYRSGDRARYRSDGTIEYIDRMDNQVQLRGFRIELGEIENVLLRHTEVDQAAVVVRVNNSHDQRLVAYVVSSAAVEDEAARVEALRGYLQGELPGYMLPGTYVFLDSLPLTANGKIDRVA